MPASHLRIRQLDMKALPAFYDAPMRALYKVLSLGSVFALAAVLTGCGNDIAKTTSCSSQADCLKAAGALYSADASVDFLPQCCASLCVVPSVGCESGYRYLNGAPLVGEGVAAPMCPARPDMTMPSGDM